MKKEKTIRTYQRKTKSGKITTVKSHTAKYDAAAEVAKRLHARKELVVNYRLRLPRCQTLNLNSSNIWTN
jgi:hypothetical protein